MKTLQKQDKFYQDTRFLLALWILITLAFVIDSWISNRLNNYLIFENTFRNLLAQKSLYAVYPEFHEDANHYGPIFSLIIAPFAILPNWLGLLFWNLFNCLLLFKAVKTLPLPANQRLMIGYIAIPCLIESMLNQQFNAAAGALIILNYTQLNKSKGLYSAFFLVLGCFVKLYGISGIVFFFFVKDKPRFILYCILWSMVLLILPMLFSSPTFVIDSYLEWFRSLKEKNEVNVLGDGRDMSVMGFFREAFNLVTVGNIMFLLLGSILYLIPLVNVKSYQNKEFQLLILSSALIFPVIFSTGAEDCTFIISITGVGIWYLLEHINSLKKIILPILLLVTCNFPLLFFPQFVKTNPLLLSMISFMYFLVWVRIIFQATLKAAQSRV